MNKNRIVMANVISKDIHKMILEINNSGLNPEEETALYTNLTLLVAEQIMNNTAIIADYYMKQETKRKRKGDRIE